MKGIPRFWNLYFVLLGFVFCSEIRFSPIDEDSIYKNYSFQNLPSEVAIESKYNLKDVSGPGIRINSKRIGSRIHPAKWVREELPIFTHIYNRNGVQVFERFIYLKAGESIHFHFPNRLNHNLNISKTGFVMEENLELRLNHIQIDKNETGNYFLTGKNSHNTISLINPGSKDIWIPNIYLVAKKIKALDLREKNSPPPIIFIVIDSLRYSAIENSGITPNLEEFRNQSVSFENHMVNSAWTRPSTTIFFTGNYASESPLNFWDYPLNTEEIQSFYKSKSHPLPAGLEGLGYKSIMIGNNPFLTDYRKIGVDFGFHKLFEYSDISKDTVFITKESIRFVQSNSKTSVPFFLFLNYNDPHRPYTPDQKFLDQVKYSIKNYKDKPEQEINYLGEVRFIDQEIGKFFSQLKQFNLWNDSLIILTSDHGEVMDERHRISPFTGTKTIYGHGQGLFQEDIHVPLFIKFPEDSLMSSYHGTRWNQLTRSIDIAPTIWRELEEDDKSMRGLPLQSILLGREERERTYYGETRATQGFREGDWKLLKKSYRFHRLGEFWKGNVGVEREFLYNLKLDPREHNPITNPHEREDLKQIYLSLKKKLDEEVRPNSVYGIRINLGQEVSNLDENSQSDGKSNNNEDLHPDENFHADRNPDRNPETRKIRSSLSAIPQTIQIRLNLNYGEIRSVPGKPFFPDGMLEKKGNSYSFTYKNEDIKTYGKEIYFQVYPDVDEPKISLYSDKSPLEYRYWGVGSFDLNPMTCRGKNCDRIYLANDGIPPPTKNFRIQIWKTGSLASEPIDTQTLGKDAMSALKKQGYVN